jgi:hypothetical protein
MAQNPKLNPRGTIKLPAHISANEMAAPVQSRKKSQPPKFLSPFGMGSIPDIPHLNKELAVISDQSSVAEKRLSQKMSALLTIELIILPISDRALFSL